jgi:hypothetical protein
MSYGVRRSDLPLAVYREVAAHLEQVDGVKTELITQQSRQFDYKLSQIDHLLIHYANNLDVDRRQQIDRILAYYGDRYGAWEILS